MQSSPVLILLGIFILFFAWNVFGLWSKMAATGKNKQMAEDKVAGLKQQKEKLSFEIDNLNTDRGKERFFRENLGLAKEGEGLIVVVEDRNPLLVPEKEAFSGLFSFFRNLFK